MTPDLFLKERLINHSEKKNPITRHLENGKPAVLFRAIRKIKLRLRLTSGQFTVSDFLQAIGHCVRLDRVLMVIFVTIQSVYDGPVI